MNNTTVMPSALEVDIAEVEAARTTLGRGGPWTADCKVSEDFLDPLFRTYFSKLNLYSLLKNKADFHNLASLVPVNIIDPEITEKLDAIVAVAAKAQPCDRGI